MKSPLWWRRLKAALLPPRRLRIIDGDSLPPILPIRDLVLARDADEDWCVGMRCPCGCGQSIELMLINDVNPRWDVHIDSKKRPSLYPSIWKQTGCRSHFWLKEGRVSWCE
ncbi:MAG: hypothetical protein K2Y51_26810 [Gammaproteobacteria bacterium]|nr:hypothetical protein [Gammaproteobacteria bacterium]